MIITCSRPPPINIDSIFIPKSTERQCFRDLYTGHITNLKQTKVWTEATQDSTYSYKGVLLVLVSLDPDGTAVFTEFSLI